MSQFKVKSCYSHYTPETTLRPTAHTPSSYASLSCCLEHSHHHNNSPRCSNDDAAFNNTWLTVSLPFLNHPSYFSLQHPELLLHALTRVVVTPHSVFGVSLFLGVVPHRNTCLVPGTTLTDSPLNDKVCRICHTSAVLGDFIFYDYTFLP